MVNTAKLKLPLDSAFGGEAKVVPGVIESPVVQELASINEMAIRGVEQV